MNELNYCSNYTRTVIKNSKYWTNRWPTRSLLWARSWQESNRWSVKRQATKPSGSSENVRARLDAAEMASPRYEDSSPGLMHVSRHSPASGVPFFARVPSSRWDAVRFPPFFIFLQCAWTLAACLPRVCHYREDDILVLSLYLHRRETDMWHRMRLSDCYVLWERYNHDLT